MNYLCVQFLVMNSNLSLIHDSMETLKPLTNWNPPQETKKCNTFGVEHCFAIN